MSAGLAGLLISIPNLTGSLLRIPFSAMVNQDGGRKPFLILLSSAAVGVAGIWVLIAFAPDRLGELFPLLLLFGALGGFGIATFSVGISQTSFWYPQRAQGSALATYAGFGNMAPGLFALLLGLLIPAIGLAGSYLAWLVFLLVGIAAYAVLGRNAPSFQLERSGMPREAAIAAARSDHGQELFPKGNARQALVDSAKVWQTWALVFVYFTTFGGFIALTAWLPKYWGSFFGLDIALTGLLTAVFSVSASLLRVAGGPVSDRLGGERAAIASLAVIGIGAVVMSLAASVAVAVVGVVLLAIGMGVANAATFKLVPQEVPNAVSGAAGWVGGLGAFGGFVIPNFMAAFLTTADAADRGYAAGFLVFVLLAGASAVLVFLMQSSRSRRTRAAAVRV